MNCSISIASASRVACVFWAAMVFQITATHASLVGDQIFADRLIPDAAGGFFSYCQEVVGSGPAGCAITVADGDSDRFALTTGNNLYANVEAFQVRFEFGPDAGGGGPFDEHLIVLNDLNFLDTDFLDTSRIISGVAFDTDLVGMDASRISYSDHGVVVNYANINYAGGAYLLLTLETVPEPSALALAVFTCLCLTTYRSPLSFPGNRETQHP